MSRISDDPDSVVEMPDQVVDAPLRDREGFWSDLFGFDGGGFSWGNVGIDHEHDGHIIYSLFGLSYGDSLNSDDPNLVGFAFGADVDPTDGNVSIGPDSGVHYDPNSGPGLSDPGLSMGYYFGIPSPNGGINFYQRPDGDPGDFYFGLPPGSALGPYPDYDWQ